MKDGVQSEHTRCFGAFYCQTNRFLAWTNPLAPSPPPYPGMNKRTDSAFHFLWRALVFTEQPLAWLGLLNIRLSKYSLCPIH